MIKFLVLLPMIALVAAGVFADGGQESSEPDRPYLELSSGWYFDSGSPTDNIDIKEEYMVWFSDFFNVELKVNPIPRNDYMTVLTLKATSGELKGMMELFGGPYMGDFFKDGASMDILPYVKDNGNWLALEEEMRNAHLVDGNLQALATGWRDGMHYIRSIRKDWLDALGMDIPTTVYELYDAIKAMTEDDPDGNGKDDTIGMVFAGKSGPWQADDIFGAFAIPTNHVSDHLITPDPHDGYRFNDGMLKPQAREALQWFQDAYTNGYIDPEVFTNGSTEASTKIYSGRFGSVYKNASWALGKGLENQILKYEDGPVDVEPVWPLTSDYASENLVLGGMAGASNIWALSSNTEDPHEMINTFVDVFLGSDVGYYSGRWGIYEKHWKFGPDGGIIRLLRSEVDGKRTYWPAYSRPAPGIAGTSKSHVVIGYTGEGEPASATKDRNDYYDRYNEAYAYAINNNLWYQYENDQWKEPKSETYDRIGADIKRIFREVFAGVTTGNMTVDEGLEKYKREVGDIGGQQMLDEANKALGKTSSSMYRY